MIKKFEQYGPSEESSDKNDFVESSYGVKMRNRFNSPKINDQKSFTLEDMANAFEAGAEASGSLDGYPGLMKDGSNPYEEAFIELKKNFIDSL